jgi:argininosuccinate lyase
MTLHEDRMRNAIEPAMFATDHAVQLAQGGMPFRDAYVQAAQSIGEMQADEQSIEESLRARCSPGACGNLMLDQIEARLDLIN